MCISKFSFPALFNYFSELRCLKITWNMLLNLHHYQIKTIFLPKISKTKVVVTWSRFTGMKFHPTITWGKKISFWQGGIPAVKKRDPALPGWTFSKVIAGYNLWRIYKRDWTRQDFIPTNRDHLINHHLAKQSESTMKYLFDTAKLFGNGFKPKTLNRPKTKFYKRNLHTKSKTLTWFWRKSIGLSHIWVQLFHPWGAFTSVRKTIPHRIFLYKIIFL